MHYNCLEAVNKAVVMFAWHFEMKLQSVLRGYVNIMILSVRSQEESGVRIDQRSGSHGPRVDLSGHPATLNN